MNNMLKNLVIWLVIGLVLMTVFQQFQGRQEARAVPMEYSEFMEAAKSGQIAKVEIQGRTIRATTHDKKQITVNSPGLYDIWMVSDLMKYGVKVSTKPEEEQSMLMQIFISWFPMLLLIGVWIFFMRQMQGGGRGGAFSFGKSRADARREQQPGHVRGCGGLRRSERRSEGTGRVPARSGQVPAPGWPHSSRRADGRSSGYR